MKEGRRMQNQLHLLCLFPMETELNPTHYKMNTQFRASSVSELKMTEKPQAAEVFVLHCLKQESVIIALILFHVVLYYGSAMGKGEQTYQAV